MDDKTQRASHWLYANEPDNFDQANSEVQRLQRTIACLIAIGIVTEGKAEQAYQIAGW